MKLSISIGNLGQVWCLNVLVPDLCPLSYFVEHYTSLSYAHPDIFGLVKRPDIKMVQIIIF